MEGSAQSVGLRVRPATPGDVPALFRMKRALTAMEGGDAILRATEEHWRRDGFGPAARFRSFIAEAAGRPAGMVTCSEVYMTALGGPVFSVNDIYVEPAQRRLGTGRKLLAAVAALALERGVPLIVLSVTDANPARSFYDRLNFRNLAGCLTYAIGGEPLMALVRLAGGEA
jgi:GNAT superfamily N-acetyltransferase